MVTLEVTQLACGARPTVVSTVDDDGQGGEEREIIHDHCAARLLGQ